ncbi:hypothetical protein HNY73_006692 [Argiope bruennichi]|uniref:Peptidase aspartic putative domain-containing protein n=1 Tax=Argiope bruennichi TaxID=94029 RepID=A0A8T0FBZ9_ARGBR|nr:hypothetical protein HNY73_006692 [Argiope bruennichi]
MKYPALKETTLIHTLFGGMQNPQKHSEYKIFVSDFNKNYHCTFNAFDQEKICAEICQIPTGFWSKELEDNGIHLTDQECLPSCSSSTIDLLIGADIAGKLMTGKILNLTCGLTATETLLGWTLMGRAPSSSGSISMTVTNLLIKDCNISDLCKLEAIGIIDPTESKKKTEMHQGTSDYFRNTLTIDEEGSLKNIDEADKFIAESQALMSLGKFNLRGWESNASLEIIDQPDKYQTVSLLGLNWDLKQDTLSCIINCPKNENLVLTKRDLLSLAQSIFDPLDISSPVTIIPKFMLQESWNLGLKCDDALPEGLSKLFWNWLKVEKLLEKRACGVEDEKEEAVQQQYVEHPELPESDETSLPNLNTMKTRFGRKIQVPNRLDL